MLTEDGQIPLQDIVGKKVTAVKEALDGVFIISESGWAYCCGKWEYEEICVSIDEEPEEHGLVLAGIITEQELDNRRAARRLRDEYRELEWRRAEYERLKKEFGE